jgi:hypothetical protein
VAGKIQPFYSFDCPNEFRNIIWQDEAALESL